MSLNHNDASDGRTLASTLAKLHRGVNIPAQALYVHIPFCKSRCHYCDFVTSVAPAAAQQAYVEALVKELAMVAEESDGHVLHSVFFGGGTPTMLSTSQLERIMEALHRFFRVDRDAEITFEANPGTVTSEKLAVLRDYGVNRLSFGAQTFNDTLLLAIGRSHDAEDIDRSIELAQAQGFKRISIDLMFGLPNQTLQDVEAALSRFLSYRLEHLSAYWLKVEPGTPFAKWEEEGHLALPGEDLEADMYHLVRQRLEAAGWKQYEVSNFAIPGGESRHNLVYWRNEPYLAAGLGAHGYYQQIRTANTSTLPDYLAHLREGRRPWVEQNKVSQAEYAENTMMLGLRLREGVSRKRFFQLHGVSMDTLFSSVIDHLVRRQLVEWRGDTLALTDQAWPVANLVFEEFVGCLASD